MKNTDKYKSIIQNIKETAEEIIEIISVKPLNTQRLAELDEQLRSYLQEGADYVAFLDLKTRYLNYMPQYK
jgi:hypothetical protein